MLYIISSICFKPTVKHYIVTGMKGELYLVEKEIFEENYEKVSE